MSKKILSILLVMAILAGSFAITSQARDAGVGTGAESFNPVKLSVAKEVLIGTDVNTTLNVEITDSAYKAKINSITAYIPYYTEGGISYLNVAYTKGEVISGAVAFDVTGTITNNVNSIVRYTVEYDLLDKKGEAVWKNLTGYTYAFVSSGEATTGAVGTQHAYPGRLSDGCYFEVLETLNTTYVQQAELILTYKIRTQSAWNYSAARTRGVNVISGNAPSTTDTMPDNNDAPREGQMDWPQCGAVYRSAGGTWIKITEPDSGYYNFTVSFNSWNDDWEDQSNITETTEMYYITNADKVNAYNAANKMAKTYTSFSDGYYVQKGMYTEESWNNYINALDIAYQVALSVPNANYGYKLACVNAQSADEALNTAFANLEEAEHDFYTYKDPVITPATCTEAGSEFLTCICGETKTVEIPATGHTRGAWTVTKEATCDAEGREEVRCTVCGEVVEEKTTPRIAHVFETSVTAPTCTESGYTTYVCTVCGYTYTSDYVSATGHEYNYLKVNPTCTAQGYTLSSCKNCDYKSTSNFVPATGHSYSAVVTDPTCTEQGFTTHTCSGCGDSYVVDYVDALGHKPLEDAVIENVVDPTLTEEGSYETVVYCEVCNEELSRETVIVPMIGGYFREAEGSTTVIDKELGYIYGLDIALEDIEDYVDYSENVTYEASDGIGTGSVIKTYRAGEEWETYTIIIFGDLNGDGVIDIYDASILAAIVNGDMQLDENSPILFAADLNNDTVADIYDLAILNSVVNGEIEIAQVPFA